MKTWNIKFDYNEICVLQKTEDVSLEVTIEGVSVRKNDTPIYQVREVITREGYPAAETSLKKRIVKIRREQEKV